MFRAQIVFSLLILGLSKVYGAAIRDPQLLALVTKQLRDALPPRAEIQIRSAQVDGKALPTTLGGGARLRLLGSGEASGFCPFELSWNEGALTVSRRGTVNYAAYAPILVASRPIRIGERFTAENTSLRPLPLTAYAHSGYFFAIEQVEPLRARAFIASGTPIGRTNAQAPAMVLSGANVELVHRRENLVLSLQVKALQSGNLDEPIRVQNLSTKRVIEARVAGPNMVSLP